MKKNTSIPYFIFTLLFALALLPQFISYAARLFQQPETAWVVWETDTPAQWSGPTPMLRAEPS